MHIKIGDYQVLYEPRHYITRMGLQGLKDFHFTRKIHKHTI